MFCLNLYPYASRKILIHNIRLDVFSAPTNLASVLIFVSSFFCDTDMIDPFLIVKVDPLRELKLECTANAASTFHLRKLILPDFNVRHNSWTTTRYFISLSSLFQSTWLGCFTLVHKTAIVGLMSGLYFLKKKKPLDTVVWKNWSLLLFSGSLPSTLNIFLGYGLATAWDFLTFIGNSSMMFYTYFHL